MTRSKIKGKSNLKRTTINFENYKKQRTICVKFSHKIKTKYFRNIDVKNVTDNKKFWKTISQRNWKKCKAENTIILVENDKICQDDKATVNTFIYYFTNVNHSVGVKKKNI